MKLDRIFLTVALCSMLGACTSLDLSNVTLAESEFSEPGKGVIVISTTAPGQCKMTAMWAHVHERRSHKIVENAPIIPIDTNRNSDFSDVYGNIRVMSLPAGSYYIAATYTTPHAGTTTRAGFAFDVRAGETTYLGELARQGACDEMAKYRVHNEYVRDISVAVSKYPAMRVRMAVTRMLEYIPLSSYTR